MPVTAGLSRSYGAVGTAVTIMGSSFGASQGTNTVTFNGVSAGAAPGWTEGIIAISAPSGAPRARSWRR